MGEYRDIPPIRSWQFYHAAHRSLGMTYMAKLYKRTIRQIYRWASDPDFCATAERNPIDRLGMLMRRLCDVGRDDIALAGARMIADAVGCDLVPRDEIAVPDKTTIEAEMLDDYPAMVALHDAIRDGAGADEVSHLARVAKGEIDETVALFCERANGKR